MTGVQTCALPISVGIGTTKPFYYVGAPFAEKDAVADKLNSLQLPGVYFRPAAFIPAYGAFAKELCQGVEIYITDAEIYRAALTGANILRCIEELYPDKVVYQPNGKPVMENPISVYPRQ